MHILNLEPESMECGFFLPAACRLVNGSRKTSEQKRKENGLLVRGAGICRRTGQKVGGGCVSRGVGVGGEAGGGEGQKTKANKATSDLAFLPMRSVTNRGRTFASRSLEFSVSRSVCPLPLHKKGKYRNSMQSSSADCEARASTSI